jgi:flagellar basal-body rod protein FlgG
MMISAGALSAFQQKLDTVSNNVANVNTTGYKRRDQSFSEILGSQINNQGRNEQETGRLTPYGIRVSYGSKAGLTQLSMEQGQAIQTGNPFDLMIQGKGFFQVGNPAGNGEVRYTRDGNFHLSPNPAQPGSFHLVHANGGLLLDQAGESIVLDEQYEVQILQGGELQLKNKNGQQAPFNSFQQIGIVEIENPHVLRNVGDNQFVIDTKVLAEGSNVEDYVRMLAPDEVQLSTGYLEGSNVDLSKEMVELMTSQRSFQMNARAVSYADQMLGIANGIMK